MLNVKEYRDYKNPTEKMDTRRTRNKVLSGFIVIALSDFSPLALSMAGPIKGPLQNV